MPSPEKTRIIVLHLTKFGETGMVAHTLDARSGRRSFLVRGLKRGNAVALFHPLSLLEAVSVESPKSSLASLREWEPAALLREIRGSRIKGSVAMFISEVLYRSFTDELSDPHFFNWLNDTVLTLESAPGSVANFPLWFLVGYAVQMGFMPDGAIEPPGLFSPEETALFFRILRSSFDEAMAIALSAGRRQDFSRKMLQYLSYHLGIHINARSLDVLHAVLA